MATTTERVLNHADAELIATKLENLAGMTPGSNDGEIDRLPTHNDGTRLNTALNAFNTRFSALVSDLNDAEVASEAGANGIRYYNNNLQYATYSYNAVTPAGTENPSEEGWYILDDGEYTLTNDTEVDASTTYYQRTTTWNTISSGGTTDIGLSVVDGKLCVTYTE